jgi:hypothetical protein
MHLIGTAVLFLYVYFLLIKGMFNKDPTEANGAKFAFWMMNILIICCCL